MEMLTRLAASLFPHSADHLLSHLLKSFCREKVSVFDILEFPLEQWQQDADVEHAPFSRLVEVFSIPEVFKRKSAMQSVVSMIKK